MLSSMYIRMLVEVLSQNLTNLSTNISIYILRFTIISGSPSCLAYSMLMGILLRLPEMLAVLIHVSLTFPSYLIKYLSMVGKVTHELIPSILYNIGFLKLIIYLGVNFKNLYRIVL